MLSNSILFAKYFDIVTFQQAVNLSPNQILEAELKNVVPSHQLWTLIYVIGKQTEVGGGSKMTLALEPQGLLNKANLAAKRNEAYLIAEKLPLRQKYSLKEFDDITDEIKEQTFAHI